MEWFIAIGTGLLAGQILWLALKGWRAWVFDTYPAMPSAPGGFPLKFIASAFMALPIGMIVFVGWWILWGQTLFEDVETKTVPSDMICIMPGQEEK